MSDSSRDFKAFWRKTNEGTIITAFPLGEACSVDDSLLAASKLQSLVRDVILQGSRSEPSGM